MRWLFLWGSLAVFVGCGSESEPPELVETVEVSLQVGESGWVNVVLADRRDDVVCGLFVLDFELSYNETRDCTEEERDILSVLLLNGNAHAILEASGTDVTGVTEDDPVPEGRWVRMTLDFEDTRAFVLPDPLPADSPAAGLVGLLASRFPGG